MVQTLPPREATQHSLSRKWLCAHPGWLPFSLPVTVTLQVRPTSGKQSSLGGRTGHAVLPGVAGRPWGRGESLALAEAAHPPRKKQAHTHLTRCPPDKLRGHPAHTAPSVSSTGPPPVPGTAGMQACQSHLTRGQQRGCPARQSQHTARGGIHSLTSLQARLCPPKAPSVIYI